MISAAMSKPKIVDNTLTRLGLLGVNISFFIFNPPFPCLNYVLLINNYRPWAAH